MQPDICSPYGATAWTKKGLLLDPGAHGLHYAATPCALALGGGRYLLAFTSRDAANRSNVYLTTALAANGRLRLTASPRLALEAGPLGTFDESGAMSSWFVTAQGVIYLYYIGWQLLASVPFTVAIGRAIYDPVAGSLRREFAGPVLGKDHANPLLSTSPCVLYDRGTFYMWYVSGLSWDKRDSGYFHRYAPRRAVSRDGVHWTSDPDPCFPFEPMEYAIAKPSVLAADGVYHMWYCRRATPQAATYRIGYAVSGDGKQWTRQDEAGGLDVSADGWDSQMTCYPHVFQHEQWLYMLYNGNNYGETGFGYAVRPWGAGT